MIHVLGERNVFMTNVCLCDMYMFLQNDIFMLKDVFKLFELKNNGYKRYFVKKISLNLTKSFDLCFKALPSRCQTLKAKVRKG